MKVLPSQHARFLIIALFAASLAMIGAVWWYYLRQRGELLAAVSHELFEVSQVKANQIVNWRRERIGDGRVLLALPVVRIASRLLSNAKPSPVDEADLLDVMSRLSQAFLYTDISLVDLTGSVHVRLNSGRTDSSAWRKNLREQFARAAVNAKDALLSDLTMDSRDGRPLMSLAVPVHDLGAIILDIDPTRFLFPYLETWPGPSRTAEILLARREEKDIVYLSRRRNAPNAPLFARRPLEINIPADAVLEEGWQVRLADYRGVPVTGTVRKIADSPWYLITKMDDAEISEPLQLLASEMVLITSLIGLISIAGVTLILKAQRERIRQEREAWFLTVANDTPAYLWMAAEEEKTFTNRPLAKFLGIEQQIHRTSWMDYVHPDDAEGARASFLECRAARREYRNEFRIRRFDGEYRWVIGQGLPRFSEEGNFTGYAGALLDITDRKQAEEQIRTTNATLASELAERVLIDQEIQALSARLIDAQEEERKRIARELHDDLSQQIAALCIATGNLKRHMPQEQAGARDKSDHIYQKLVELAEKVRRISHRLHPAVLQYSGLAAAVRAYCSEFESLTGVHTTLRINGLLEDLPSSTALCVYRITQEALQNVSKHAKVAEATIQLDCFDGLLSLTVADQGVGMEPSHPGTMAGLGLVSIRERTRLARGTFRIQSQPNQGTRLEVRIPL